MAFLWGAARNGKSVSETIAHPSSPLLWGDSEKPSLMEVAERCLKEVAKGQVRGSPALVAFLCRRQAFAGTTTAAPWYQLETWGLAFLCLDRTRYVNSLFILSFLLQ